MCFFTPKSLLIKQFSIKISSTVVSYCSFATLLLPALSCSNKIFYVLTEFNQISVILSPATHRDLIASYFLYHFTHHSPKDSHFLTPPKSCTLPKITCFTTCVIGKYCWLWYWRTHMHTHTHSVTYYWANLTRTLPYKVRVRYHLPYLTLPKP